MISTQQDAIYRYTTPQKSNDFVNDKAATTSSSNARTVSTVASEESPFPLSPLNLDINFIPPYNSPLNPPPLYDLSPESLRRANLMTLVVDQDYSSPYSSVKKHTKTNKLDTSSVDDGSTVPITFQMDKGLVLMMKSTDRQLTDAEREIAREINREYSSPHSVYSYSEDEQEQELCHEMNKVKHSEETFRHELNFAIDKIAYRHASTREWATEMNLIGGPTAKSCNASDRNSRKHYHDDDDQSWFEKVLDIFCCNHTFGEKRNIKKM